LNNQVNQVSIQQFQHNDGTQVRLAAAMIVLEVLEQGRSLSTNLTRHTAKFANARDIALTHEIACGVLRLLPQLRLQAANFLNHGLKTKDSDVEYLILVGLYQLTALRIPHYAVISQTVAAARLLNKSWAAGLVNAVLRGFQRYMQTSPITDKKIPTLPHNFPIWLASRLQQAWSENALTIMRNSDQHPPMTLRVNLSRIAMSEYVELLIANGITARPVSQAPTALILDKPIDTSILPGFANGLVSVQDAAAQLAVELLQIESQQRILDACAAPGGKTNHILELHPNAVVTAVDIDESRLNLLRQNLQRLGQKAIVIAGDVTDSKFLNTRFHTEHGNNLLKQNFDRILCDVPCTATGVIRRHPDIKWLRRPTDIAPLVALQANILDAVWNKLKPSGILLYVTCSLFPEENEQQILNFLQRTSNACEMPIETKWGQALTVGRQIFPGDNNMDGFYFARLYKRV
jgi:16S rRNA (cytosine967-C5)-methyltransferase